MDESMAEDAANYQMAYDQTWARFEAGELENEYAEYIMTHGIRAIGNGDMLTKAMEDQYLAEAFIQWKANQ